MPVAMPLRDIAVTAGRCQGCVGRTCQRFFGVYCYAYAHASLIMTAGRQTASLGGRLYKISSAESPPTRPRRRPLYLSRDERLRRPSRRLAFWKAPPLPICC